jgi:hypothetical protein
VGKNVFRDRIVHPDSLPAKRAFFDTIVRSTGAPITAEFRVRHADGSWRDIEAVGQNFLDDPSEVSMSYSIPLVSTAPGPMA